MSEQDAWRHRNNASLNDLEFQMARIELESRPTWMQIEPTVVCNLHCRMCRDKSANTHPGRESATDLFEGICASGWLDYLNYIEINGWGETFAHRGVGAFLDECAQHRELNVHVTTNGLLLGDDDLLRAICRMPKMRLTFSIDSPDAAAYEYIRRGASFARLTDNIARLARYRADTRGSLEVGCNCLVNRLNLTRLRAMVDFARRHHFSSLLFIRLHGLPELEVSDDEAMPAMDDAIEYARGLEYCCEGYSRPAVPERNDDPQGFFWRCLRPWNHVQVLSNGDVVPCCFLSSPSSDAGMGNLLRTPLDEIWNCSRYEALRRSAYRDFPEFCARETGGCAAKVSRQPNIRMT